MTPRRNHHHARNKHDPCEFRGRDLPQISRPNGLGVLIIPVAPGMSPATVTPLGPTSPSTCWKAKPTSRRRTTKGKIRNGDDEICCGMSKDPTNSIFGNVEGTEQVKRTMVDTNHSANLSTSRQAQLASLSMPGRAFTTVPNILYPKAGGAAPHGQEETLGRVISLHTSTNPADNTRYHILRSINAKHRQPSGFANDTRSNQMLHSRISTRLTPLEKARETALSYSSSVFLIKLRCSEAEASTSLFWSNHQTVNRREGTEPRPRMANTILALYNERETQTKQPEIP